MWQRLKRALGIWALLTVSWYGIAAVFMFSETARENFPLPLWGVIVLPIVFSPFLFIETFLVTIFDTFSDNETKANNGEGESGFRKRVREDREKRKNSGS